uniref:rRNA adenine N(6)-methyltransferase n=1 Tax=Paulinella chromatophora TaxID=39717 RepID=B1X420_PAUCH|nr:putative rRNA (adenine-N6,N6)- dimethyltransferase [Paulinella chromatophora]ACB42689.1 putative rRNA (adenine-N6,N6)- dimethyltransferase [Paulinella chromatophora]
MTFSGHAARKDFGQHWLKDKSILNKIILAADLSADDIVLEIGSGRGALTESLLASSALLTLAVELDRDLASMLRKRLGTHTRFALIEGDILRINFPNASTYTPNKVVANIPYNITGPLLKRLLGSLNKPLNKPYKKIVLLVQQEVGDRIRANPGHTSYSALSVKMQLLARCYSVCIVPPHCFDPSPSVVSEVIVLEPLNPDQHLMPELAIRVEELLKFCFSSRRKMLRNSLTNLVPIKFLEIVIAKSGISLEQRPQELTPSQWVDLAASLSKFSDFPQSSLIAK